MQEDPTRKVSLKWANRKNQTCSNCSSSLSHTTNQASQFITDNGKTQIQSLWYSFDSPSTQGFTISDSASIGKFWFEIQEGNNKIVEDQNGIGYGLQDMVMISVTSCESSSGLKLDVAVCSLVTPPHAHCIIIHRFSIRSVRDPPQAAYTSKPTKSPTVSQSSVL